MRRKCRCPKGLAANDRYMGLITGSLALTARLPSPLRPYIGRFEILDAVLQRWRFRGRRGAKVETAIADVPADQMDRVELGSSYQSGWWASHNPTVGMPPRAIVT